MDLVKGTLRLSKTSRDNLYRLYKSCFRLDTSQIFCTVTEFSETPGFYQVELVTHFKQFSFKDVFDVKFYNDGKKQFYFNQIELLGRNYVVAVKEIFESRDTLELRIKAL